VTEKGDAGAAEQYCFSRFHGVAEIREDNAADLHRVSMIGNSSSRFW